MKQIDIIRQRLAESSEIIKKLHTQIALMHIPRQKKILIDPKCFEEQVVRNDIFHLFDIFSYLEQTVLYHHENYNSVINDVLNAFESQAGLIQANDISQISCNPLLANKLGYEFDSLMVTFNKTFEYPMIAEIEKYMSKRTWAFFPKNLISRDNLDGFYWRINILRNRAAHPDEPRYSNVDGEAKQFYGLSSKPIPFIIVSNDKVELNCTLFDIAENAWIKEVIRKEIIKKKSDSNIVDILFPEKSAKGHGKNSPQMLFYSGNLKLFDYFNNFWKLSNDILNYFHDVNHLFMKDAIRLTDKTALDEK